MTLLRGGMLTVALSALAAAFGVWGGVWYVRAQAHHPPSLHEMVHEQLHLTADQQRRIERLEREYAVERGAQEAEMRAANAQLAQAYQRAHAFTPQAQAAIDRFHRAQDALQKDTMEHVVAMRAVLTPDQAAQFDDTVAKALTSQGS
jgi:Spy/CpxP family protein refolding chaperone